MALIGQSNSSGTLSASGSTTATRFSGGALYVGATGAFGGGTLTVQVSYDGGTTFISIPDSDMTADDTFSVDLPDCHVRLTLSGATSPDIDWFLAQRAPV